MQEKATCYPRVHEWDYTLAWKRESIQSPDAVQGSDLAPSARASLQRLMVAIKDMGRRIAR